MVDHPRKQAKISKEKEKAFSSAHRTLEAWFPQQRLRQDYLTFHSTKEVMKPHFVDLEWYSKVGFRFGREFVSQGLGKLVTMKGWYYLELVKVFYTCLKTNENGELTSKVNG